MLSVGLVPGVRIGYLAQPVQIGLLLYTLLLVLVVRHSRPPIRQTTVFAFAPWFVTGAVLHVLSTAGVYAGGFSSLLAGVGAHLSVTALAGTMWILLLGFSAYGKDLAVNEYYLGAMGIGTASILLMAVMLGGMRFRGIIYLIGIPALALISAVIVTVVTWLWSADFLEYTDLIGGYVVFGSLLNGLGTVASVALYGPVGHTATSLLVRDAVLAYWIPLLILDWRQTWIWVFLVSGIAVAVALVTTLAPHARERPRTVYAILGIVGSGFVASGMVDVLVVVTGVP